MMAPWLFMGAAVIGVLHLVLPQGFFKRALSGRAGVMNAVLLGVPLPLCSCAVIPVAVGMRKSGAPKSATIAFLVSTPQTGVDSIMVTGGFLGWPFAAYRVFVAVVMGLVSGGLTHVVDTKDAEEQAIKKQAASSRGVSEALAHAWTSLDSIWGWVIVGVLVSAAINQLGPIGETFGLQDNIALGSLAALLVAVPLYVCATASIPIAASLIAAGLPVEAALVFLIAGPATNTATIGAVYASLGRKVTVVYLSVTILGSLLFAWLFTLALPNYTIAATDHHEHGSSLWATVLGIAFIGVTVFWIVDRLRIWRRSGATPEGPRQELGVDGMTCQGCVRKLQAAPDREQRTQGAVVELPPGRVHWSGQIDPKTVSDVIESTGFAVRLGQE